MTVESAPAAAAKNGSAGAAVAPSRPRHGELAGQIYDRVGRAVVGQEVAVELLLIALLTGGHLLLEGVPGLAKSLLVQSLAKSIDLSFARVQFTIDLLPADLTGSEILDPASQTFRTHKGPVFANLLLADEIDRAAPKVQSPCSKPCRSGGSRSATRLTR